MIWLSITLIAALAVLLIGKLTKYWLILVGICLVIFAGVYFYLGHRDGINHPIETIKTSVNSKKV